MEDAGHVLLVEDNPGDARLVREMLQDGWKHGPSLIHVSDMAAARNELLGSSISCVLLDLSLPDAEGLEALAQLRSVDPEVPIVVLTGLDDEKLAVDAVQQGAQDYLIKGRADAYLLSRATRYAIERKRAESELIHQALHDSLTGLPNRAVFLDRLTLALSRLERDPGTLAVLFVDLDGFKFINDSLGHDAGDELLQNLADRLRGAVRPSDTVARFGGDEFVCLCENISDVHAATAIAGRIAESVIPPAVLQGGEVFLSTSIGIALASGPDNSAEHLLRDADAAMYRAKEKGRNHFEVFDETMRARVVKRMETENALHRAVERDELRVLYQPEVKLDEGKIVGVEALVRWEHPEQGLMEPMQFIPIAEETGIIHSLGSWVLSEACKQATIWQDSCADESLILRVNLSARQLAQPDLQEVVSNTLDESELEPSSLCLELTESAMMHDPEASMKVLGGLKDLGVMLCIDDFGTGYSSLSYLKRLKMDSLKVDKSFVEGLGRDPDDSAIVAAVVSLANALRLGVVAEGVETSDQLNALRELGCVFAQGYYFARPQPADSICTLLDGGTWLDRINASGSSTLGLETAALPATQVARVEAAG